MEQIEGYVLKIFFTPTDLARTRISAAPQPMWEIILSLHRLRRRDGGMVFDEWRRAVLAKVPGETRLVTDLAPSVGYYADFLTPMPEGSSLDEGIAQLMETPRRRLRTDLAVLAGTRRLPTWTETLGDGRPETLRRVGDAVDRYFAACLSPYWQQVRAGVDRERARQSALLATGGLEMLLQQLHGSAQWRYPVLEVAYPVDRELHLDGRGLHLVPSFFCWGEPTTFRDAGFAPTLVYPIKHEIGWSAFDETRRPLAALLGPTRAKVLETIGERTATTSDVARLTETTLPTASRQTSVLRSAGLITSSRHGQSVLHSLTEQGRSLLADSGI
jgi:DNA-binding transcriptional ArsR family regulator